MTFFLILGKKHLINHFSAAKTAASKSDDGYFGEGKFLAKFGVGRDLDLSQDKQVQADNAILALRALTEESLQQKFKARPPSQKDKTFDDFVEQKFIGIITKYNDEIRSIVGDHQGTNMGRTSAVVNDAHNLLRGIKTFCRGDEVSIWNEAFDEYDPLLVFIYYCAEYICSKFNDKDQVLTQEKLQIAQEIIKFAAIEYSAMREASPLIRANYIKRQITFLLSGNERLLDKHSTKLPLYSTFLGSFSLATSVKPSAGMLKKVLEQAERHIQKLIDWIEANTEEARSRITLPRFENKPRPSHKPPAPTSAHATVETMPAVGQPTSIREAIAQDNREYVVKLLDGGFDITNKIHGQSVLEYALTVGSQNVIDAIKSHPNTSLRYIDKIFDMACTKGDWRAAMLLNSEKGAIAKIDAQFTSQLHWYSFNNTAIKRKYIDAVEEKIDRSASSGLNKKQLCKYASQSSTATYRQFQFWNSADTNTTKNFKEKLDDYDRHSTFSSASRPLFSNLEL